MKNYLLILITLVFFIACQKEQKQEEPKGLKLTILNKDVSVFCPNSDCTKIPDSLTTEKYLKASKTTIKFKIENPDEQTYMFVPFCFNSWETGCPSIHSFPDEFAQLDLNNLIFYNSKNEKAKIEGYLGRLKNDKIENHQIITDSVKKIYHESLNQDSKRFKWKVTNEFITNRMITIAPKEVLFFEVPVNLPINYNSIGSVINEIQLNKAESYKMKLIFNSKIDSVESYLSKSQLKTFRANNYRFFGKELISSNSIDVKFTD